MLYAHTQVYMHSELTSHDLLPAGPDISAAELATWGVCPDLLYLVLFALAVVCSPRELVVGLTKHTCRRQLCIR